ncbi:MAG: DUF559 domain-containing protein [Candidatus Taylorbacteria bacterium]|nr:DUF559 domain-containing protein [Candidatus Taylorbacteria bacterium]
MKIHYNQNLKILSRQLRNNCTLGEVLLWKEIKGKKLGYQFMRQKPIADYIVDFYCSPLGLAIEIDGISHDTKVTEDNQRQKEIEKLGIDFLRFAERDVKENLDSVIREIKDFINQKTTSVSRNRHPLS